MKLMLADLVQRFDSGAIRLPLMQRDYVWKPQKVVKLLDSLYRSWPIGSFYVWQTDEAQPEKVRLGNSLKLPMDGFYGFLLDGQQRLTSLSLAIRTESQAPQRHRGFFDVFNERFFLGEMNKTINKRIENEDPLLIPLSNLIRTSKGQEQSYSTQIEEIIAQLQERGKVTKGEEAIYRDRLHKVSSMFKREALCEEFPDASEDDAFELFSRLNKGGTSLSAGDVEAARLSSAATKNIVNPMRRVVSETEMQNLGINFVFLLRSLVTVHRGNCSFAKLPKSWADDSSKIQSSWNQTEVALRETVQFVRQELGWTTSRWLPSVNSLIPVIYLFSKIAPAKLTSEDAKLVKRYFLLAGLRGLFRAATETSINFYVNAVRDAADISRSNALLQRIPKNRLYKIKPDDIQHTAGLYSPLMQTYLAYLLDRQAKSWPSGRKLRDALLEELSNDPLSVHHIFPRKFMQDRDFPIDRLNCPANYAILTQSDNAGLGDRDPHEAWLDLKLSQREEAAIQLCFIANGEYLKREAYDEFIAYRAVKVAEQLNAFLNLK